MNKDIKKTMTFLKKQTALVTKKIKYKVYYNDDGSLVSYTTGVIKGKKFVLVDQKQYMQCRMDGKVIDGVLIFPDLKNTVVKMDTANDGVKCSEYDLNIIASDDDTGVYWNERINNVR